MIALICLNSIMVLFMLLGLSSMQDDIDQIKKHLDIKEDEE